MSANICCCRSFKLPEVFVLIYLQETTNLQITHPAVFEKFNEGLHVVCRSDRFKAGMISDLVIEITLMRSFKTGGSMTHGSGMPEKQRSIWTMSRYITADFKSSMQIIYAFENF